MVWVQGPNRQRLSVLSAATEECFSRVKFPPVHEHDKDGSTFSLKLCPLILIQGAKVVCLRFNEGGIFFNTQT